MFWQKKGKNEGLPELPPAPNSRIELPPIIPITEETPEGEEIKDVRIGNLPKLPPIENQPMMRLDEIQESAPLPLPQLKSKMPQLMEVNESESAFPEQDFQEIRQTRFPQQIESGSMPAKDKHAIFVKIDKFKTARGSLTNVQEKLGEIDDLFKKLKDTKVKEDVEINYLEKELQSLKGKIRTVIEEVFEKTE